MNVFQLKEISIYFNDHEKQSLSLYNTVIIYDYLTDIYYATKINKKNIHQQYKLGVLNDTDPKHLSNVWTNHSFYSLFSLR